MMKFKEKRGNTFVFDGGYAGKNLELEQAFHGGVVCFFYNGVILFKDLSLKTMVGEIVQYSDIQTAVNLMQILIEEGLV